MIIMGGILSQNNNPFCKMDFTKLWCHIVKGYYLFWSFLWFNTLWFGFLTIKKEKIVDDKYTEWPSDSVEWELPYDLSITPERQPAFYYCVVKFIW